MFLSFFSSLSFSFVTHTKEAQSSEKDLNDFGGASGDREDEGDAKMTEDVATTEWGNMQRKLGNWKPLTKKRNTNDERNNKTLWFPRVEKKTREDDAGKDGKDDDDVNDDDDDESIDDEEEEDYAFMASYREKRISEMILKSKSKREEHAKKTFGGVRRIERDEWTTEVTSSSYEIPVVVLLVKENNAACDRLEKVVEDLADKYRTKTKFVRADATEIIPNYPERNTPTIILYRNGDVVENIVGIEQFGGRNGVNSETVRRRVRAHAKSDEFLMDERDAEESLKQ